MPSPADTLRRVIISCFLAVVFVWLTPGPVYAVVDPLGVPNNKFGIHVADVNDLTEAARLVNSAGGDWGYVTLVIQDDDRNAGKWQDIFNQCRRLRLIPLVRLATHVHGDAWAVPDESDINAWGDFLNSLSWPTENRYVILFNEPNHSKEWGNRIDPEGYVDIYMKLRHALKSRSEDFFVLPAGLDSAASTDGEALDAGDYLTRMVARNGAILSQFDGWTSHSYPNPGFASSPHGFGKGSIRSFQWEITKLKQLGLTRTLPVFITETGWMHREGKYYTSGLPTAAEAGEYMKIAAANVWNDPSVVAVTPFLLNYQDYPFDHFSMRKLQSPEYYETFGAYQGIAKTAGEPRQREALTFIGDPLMPEKLVNDSVYQLEAVIINDGQSIIDPTKNYTLSFTEESGLFTAITDAVPYLEPGSTGKLRISVRAPKTQGSYPVEISVRHGGKTVLSQKRRVFIIPPPSLEAHVQFGWRTMNAFRGATVLIYGMDDTLIHSFTDLSSKDGSVRIDNLTRIIPGRMYRLVFLLPPYLPRQELVVINPDTTKLSFKRLIPLDFSADGTITAADIVSFVRTPPVVVWGYLF